LKYSLLIGSERSPENLKNSGLILKVNISTATYIVDQALKPAKTISVWALFDTGASHTYISEEIASFLELSILGGSKVSTAHNRMDSKKHAVDLSLVNSPLKPFTNLEVWSFHPHRFDLEHALKEPNDYKNYGVLIGRDIMSNWNITWDGPSSTVIISD
jgi:Aspartyl protease